MTRLVHGGYVGFSDSTGSSMYLQVKEIAPEHHQSIALNGITHTHNLIWLYQWEIEAIDTQTLIGQPILTIRKPTKPSNLRFNLVKKSRSLVCRSQKLRTDVSCTLAMVPRSHISNYTNN